MKSLLSLILSLSLVGCATCTEHRVACGVGMAIVAGSIVASSRSHRSASPPDQQIGTPSCGQGACQ